MIFLVTGTDYIWKMAFIEWATEKWQKPYEQIWADEVEEGWLRTYIEQKNELVIRNAEVLKDTMVERITDWRPKDLIFESPDMPSGALRRKLVRAGRLVECMPGHEHIKTRVIELAKRMGCQSIAERVRRNVTSMTEAYWAFHMWRLGVAPEAAAWQDRRSYPGAVLKWEEAVLNKSVEDLLMIVRGLVRISLLIKEGQNKWRVVQEAINLDHTQVGPLYGEGVNLSESEELRKSLLRRMRVISQVLEDEPTTPIEYVYLVAR